MEDEDQDNNVTNTPYMAVSFTDPNVEGQVRSRKLDGTIYTYITEVRNKAKEICRAPLEDQRYPHLELVGKHEVCYLQNYAELLQERERREDYQLVAKLPYWMKVTDTSRADILVCPVSAITTDGCLSTPPWAEEAGIQLHCTLLYVSRRSQQEKDMILQSATCDFIYYAACQHAACCLRSSNVYSHSEFYNNG